MQPKIYHIDAISEDCITVEGEGLEITLRRNAIASTYLRTKASDTQKPFARLVLACTPTEAIKIYGIQSNSLEFPVGAGKMLKQWLHKETLCM